MRRTDLVTLSAVLALSSCAVTPETKPDLGAQEFDVAKDMTKEKIRACLVVNNNKTLKAFVRTNAYSLQVANVAIADGQITVSLSSKDQAIRITDAKKADGKIDRVIIFDKSGLPFEYDCGLPQNKLTCEQTQKMIYESIVQKLINACEAGKIDML